jgi:hypothetical protein
MADVNIGQLASTTLQKYQPKMVDNIFKKHVLLNHLKKNGGTPSFTGGPQLVAPLMYGKNSTVQTFDGTDTLDTTYQEGIDSATYDWKFYNVAVAFTLVDKIKNRGKEAVMSLLKGKITQAEKSLSEKINTDLISGTDSKGLVGLGTMISTSTTVGGISGSTYSWWRGNVDATAETLSFADLRTIKNSCNNGNGGSKVSMILSTQTLYEKMFAMLTATYQFNPTQAASKEGKRLAEASFETLEFEGTPVAYDESMTSGAVYLINKDNYKLGILKDMNFDVVDKSQPYDQHVSIQHIVFGGAAFTDRRASLGALTGKTA